MRHKYIPVAGGEITSQRVEEPHFFGKLKLLNLIFSSSAFEPKGEGVRKARTGLYAGRCMSRTGLAAAGAVQMMTQLVQRPALRWSSSRCYLYSASFNSPSHILRLRLGGRDETLPAP